MVVGVKYCGGCNPRYDRTGFLKRLMDDLEGEYTFEVIQSRKAYDILLVLGGCHNCCADYGNIPTELGVIRVTGEKDYKKVLDTLQGEFPNDNK